MAPVIIDEDKCIADKGCTVCVDVCPMDLLAIDPTTQKAYMQFDECWYCMLMCAEKQEVLTW